MARTEQTHRRRNPLNGSWVLVSPHRNNRPWQGATEAQSQAAVPSYDEHCPLCPGNIRANGSKNPDYAHTHVFVNDFGAINDKSVLAVAQDAMADELFTTAPAIGECRVVCFSPDHSKSLPEMAVAELLQVVDVWQRNYAELIQRYPCVHIFENKGAVMGCSQPHPHGQIWAHNHLSTEIANEDQRQRDYWQQHQRSLLGDYVLKEQAQGQRVVCENEHWLALVPFWAAWPFETILISKDDISNFCQLNSRQRLLLASILREVTTRYDNVFECSFPYSMGWHNAPGERSANQNRHWRLHAHFYPPLLRSASVKKHMVGYEMLAESQRDLTPEKAAEILRAVSPVHYRQQSRQN